MNHEDANDRLAQAVEADACRPLDDEALQAAVQRLADAAMGSLLALVFFGSRSSGAGANPHSAYDLFVIVSEYAPFYDTIRAAGLVQRRPGFLALLNGILPPNQVSIRFGDFHGKCAVISLKHFLRDTSYRRRDHFCQGRLFQPVSLVHAACDDVRHAVLQALVDVRRQTLNWSAPYLPPSFDVDAYCLRLLEVSLSGEVRPESTARAKRLAEAQRSRQHPIYAALLELFAQEKSLLSQETGFTLSKAPSALLRLRCRLYFAQSLVRATLRWGKHMLTFEGWLDYLVRKVERHSGRQIELTARERRYPLVFLWPRFFRHMKSRNQGETR